MDTKSPFKRKYTQPQVITVGCVYMSVAITYSNRGIDRVLSLMHLNLDYYGATSS